MIFILKPHCSPLWPLIRGGFLYPLLCGVQASATPSTPLPVPVFQMQQAVVKIHSPFEHNAYGSGFFIGSHRHFVTAFHNIKFLVDTSPDQPFRPQDILLSPRGFPFRDLERDHKTLKVLRVLSLNPLHDTVLLEVEGHSGPVLKASPSDHLDHNSSNSLNLPREMYLAGFLGKNSLFKIIRGSYVPYGSHSRQTLLFIQNHESTVQGISGGPVLNSRGEVMGMASAMYAMDPTSYFLNPREQKAKLLRLYPQALKGRISALQDLIKIFATRFYSHQSIVHIIPVEKFLETNNTFPSPSSLRDQVKSSFFQALKHKNLKTNEDNLIILGTLVESDILNNIHLSREDKTNLLQILRGELIPLYRTAAREEGQREVQFHLGRVLSASHQNHERAEGQKWFKRAAQAGHFLAQYEWGRFLTQTGQPDHYEEGISWIQSSAAQGYNEARHTLGILLLNQNNTSEAIRWLRAAALQDHTLSQMTLSLLLLHHNPRGNKKEDQEEGRKWLRQAMENILGYPPPDPESGGFVSKLGNKFRKIKCFHLFE